MLYEETTNSIISSFYAVYDVLGYGFLEAVYCNALAIEFEARGLKFIREAPIDIYYKGARVGHYRADFLVEDKIVVEVKAARALVEADRAQTVNCLRGSKNEVALLLHFGPKPAFKRIFFENSRKLGLPSTESS
jgi:GxxExxY protein